MTEPFFSHAFRGQVTAVQQLAGKIRDLCAKQLLLAPYSSVHEDEALLYRNDDKLLEFIKTTSRGNAFNSRTRVEHTQILKQFASYVEGGPVNYEFERGDVFSSDVNGWEDYLRIEVGRFRQDTDAARKRKDDATEQLVEALEDWRRSQGTFDSDVASEMRDAGRHFIRVYLEYAMRIANGDYAAWADSPADSLVVAEMVRYYPDELSVNDRMRSIFAFLSSQHFMATPYLQISARIFATLKKRLREGNYSNRKKARQSFSGLFHDIHHIGVYAPYCETFLMDRAMADLVRDPLVGLERDFGCRVMTMGDADALRSWLDRLQAQMSNEHREALALVYPA